MGEHLSAATASQRSSEVVRPRSFIAADGSLVLKAREVASDDGLSTPGEGKCAFGEDLGPIELAGARILTLNLKCFGVV
jgi:hypothetical protein